MTTNYHFDEDFLDYINNDAIYYNYEICGSLFNINGILTPNMIYNGSLEGRRSCVNFDLSEMDFHTHPIGSKWYPSGEDICNIMFESKNKNKNLIKSFVFNEFGYWVISLTNEKKEDNFVEKEETAKYINNYISRILHRIGRGRILPEIEIINFYIDEIEKYSNNIKLEFYKKRLKRDFSEKKSHFFEEKNHINKKTKNFFSKNKNKKSKNKRSKLFLKRKI